MKKIQTFEKSMKNDILTPESIQLSKELDQKVKQIEQIFTDHRVIVAFSGGMDSTLLVYLAKLYAKQVLPIIVKDPTTPVQELLQADHFTQLMDLPLRIIELNTLDIPEFTQNHPNRCYYCKKNLLSALEEIAKKEHFSMVVDGTNLTDLTDTRPGLQALKESHTISPLANAHFSKTDIQELSKLLHLPSFNLPSQACLASRVPFFIPITSDLLHKIDLAEQYIRELINNIVIPIRVRVHPIGTNSDNKWLARIESNEELLIRLLDTKFRQEIITKFSELGFIFITIDLEGFITGKMHRMVKETKNNGID